jgi:hypothetical protein
VIQVRDLDELPELGDLVQPTVQPEVQPKVQEAKLPYSFYDFLMNTHVVYGDMKFFVPDNKHKTRVMVINDRNFPDIVSWRLEGSRHVSDGSPDMNSDVIFFAQIKDLEVEIECEFQGMKIEMDYPMCGSWFTLINLTRVALNSISGKPALAESFARR